MCLDVCVCVCECMRTCACECVHDRACVRVCALCVCVRTCAWVSVFGCVHLHTVNLHECDSFFSFSFYRACMSPSHYRVSVLADHADVSG